MRQADKLKYADSISEIKIKRMSTGYSEEIFPHEEEYEDYDDGMGTFFFLKLNIQSKICEQEFHLNFH